MEKLFRILSKVAFSTHPVLILGESGTGKETVARTIHNSGPNANRRFAVVESSQLAPAVLESELFRLREESLYGFQPAQGGHSDVAGRRDVVPGWSKRTAARSSIEAAAGALQDKEVKAPGCGTRRRQ